MQAFSAPPNDASVGRAYTEPEFPNYATPMGDWNGDGIDDVMFRPSDYGYVLMVQPDGSTVYGSRDGYSLSASVSADLNGDGQAELMSARYEQYYSRYAYAGPFPSENKQDTGLPGECPSGPYQGTGITAGDLNGDGYDDFVVSCPGWYGTEWYDPDSGYFNIFSGHPDLSQIRLDRQFGAGDHNDMFGYRLSAGHDLDQDGYDDLVVTTGGCGYISGQHPPGSAYYNDNPTNVQWIRGGPNLLELTPQGGAVVRWELRSRLGTEGWCDGAEAEMVPDVNGDGYPDLAVSGKEKVRLYLGGPDGPEDTPVWERSAEGICINTSWEYRCLDPDYIKFLRLVGLGDVNGDGYGDLGFVRAWGVEIHYGAPFGVFEGDPLVLDVDRYAHGVGTFGDLTGDGAAELVLVSPWDSHPEDYTYPSTGEVHALSWAWAAFVFEGLSPLDLDGDGVNRGADCNDFRASIYPGALDVGGNGIDENCDGVDGFHLVVASQVGQRVTLEARGGVAGSTVALVGSVKGPGTGPCPPELGGQCVGLRQAQLVGTDKANALGVAEWTVTLPPGTTSIWAQAWALSSPALGSGVLKVR